MRMGGWSRTRQTLLAPSAKRRGVFGEWHEGWTASFPRTVRKKGLRHLVPTFLLMDDSANEL